MDTYEAHMLHQVDREDFEPITSYEHPPIPVRNFDWRAYVDGDEEITRRHGWGRTEAEAIENLKDILRGEQE